MQQHMKVKALVAAGNELAKQLNGDDAVLLKELVIQMEVQRVRADTLAQESAGALLTISSIIEILGPSESISLSGQVAELKSKHDALAAENVDLKERITCWEEGCEPCWETETPATAAALADIEARGVEKLLNSDPAELIAAMPAYRQMTVSEDNVRDVLNAVMATLKLRKESGK